MGEHRSTAMDTTGMMTPHTTTTTWRSAGEHARCARSLAEGAHMGSGRGKTDPGMMTLVPAECAVFSRLMRAWWDRTGNVSGFKGFNGPHRVLVRAV